MVKFSKENDGWKVFEIQGAETPNDMKVSIEIVPGFHEDKFPFLVCTGRVETWLVNVNTLKAQTLFTKSSLPYFA